VVGISGEAAEAYCAWLGKRLGLVCRLPTRLEWEKAARGVDGRAYVWGNTYEPGRALLRDNPQRGEFPPLRSFAVSRLEKFHLKCARLVEIDAFPVVETFVRIPYQPGELDDVVHVSFDRMFACVAFAAQMPDKTVQEGADFHFAVFNSAEPALKVASSLPLAS